MSTLVLVLAAGMAMGSEPAPVSGEMEQRLDLSGEWEGIWWIEAGKRHNVTSNGSVLFGTRGGAATLIDTKDIIDEGSGRFRGKWLFANDGIHGIYKRTS